MTKMDPEEEYLQLTMIQEPNINIYKLLLNSIQHNHYAIFKSLLKRELEKRPLSIEIDYTYPHPLNKTLLDISCTKGLSEFTELLLEFGADPNKINSSHNRGPLHFTTESGHVNVLKVLLEDPRSNPNLEVARETALHLAVRKNYPDCAKVLLDNNASPNIPNSKGMTPIHGAAADTNREMVLTILNHSRLPPDLDNFYDFKKKTARDVIIQTFPDIHLPPKMPKRVDYNILRFYLDANDEKNFLNHLEMIEDDTEIDRERLIKLATEKNLIISVRALIKGIDPTRNLVAEEAVEVAVKRGHVEILAELLNLGVKIKDNLILIAAKELGITLRANLHQDNRLKCLQMILELPNINVRCKDEKGNTPLHYAARAECEAAVVLLLKHGSYLGAKNILGVSPLAHITPGLLHEYFNDCLRSNNDRTDDYEIEFNYECFIPHTTTANNNSESSLLQNNCQTSMNSKMPLFTELEPFNYIAHNRLCESLDDFSGRENANHVDLNRDFPDQFVKYPDQYLRNENIGTGRQSETIAMMTWIVNHPFVLSGNFHGGAVVASYPYDSGIRNNCCEESRSPDDKLFKYLAHIYADNHQVMRNGEACKLDKFDKSGGVINGAYWYKVIGGMQDFNYAQSNAFEITFELSCCKYPNRTDLPIHWNLNKESLLKYLEQAHIGIKGIVENSEGERIEDARIHVDGINHTVKTTVDGEYWRLLLPGEYIVYATAWNYKPSEPKRVIVENGQPTIINFTLNRISRDDQGKLEMDYPQMIPIIPQLSPFERMIDDYVDSQDYSY